MDINNAKLGKKSFVENILQYFLSQSSALSAVRDSHDSIFFYFHSNIIFEARKKCCIMGTAALIITTPSLRACQMLATY